MADLVLLHVALIDDHVDNPRLSYRDDVINEIAKNFNCPKKEHAFTSFKFPR